MQQETDGNIVYGNGDCVAAEASPTATGPRKHKRALRQVIPAITSQMPHTTGDDLMMRQLLEHSNMCVAKTRYLWCVGGGS